MRRVICAAFLLQAPALFASDDFSAFWHLDRHGDSILLILFGAWLVRRQCFIAMYPEKRKSRVTPRTFRHGVVRDAMKVEPTWSVQFALLPMWLRTQILNRFLKLRRIR